MDKKPLFTDSNEFIHALCLDYERISSLLQDPRENPNVKRGLRNADGTGVMVGYTQIGNVRGYSMIDGEKTPMEGRLFYRGYNMMDLINGFFREGRFGFEEVVDGLGAYRKEFVVNRHADAFLTSSHAERATEFNLVFKTVLVDKILQPFNNLS